MIIFIFFPAMLFTYFEGFLRLQPFLWLSINFFSSPFFQKVGTIRFQFITLLLRWQPLVNFIIKFQSAFNVYKLSFFSLCEGFGDYVPTFQPHQERTYHIYFVFYQLFILLWFITGTFVTSFPSLKRTSLQMLVSSSIFKSHFWFLFFMFFVGVGYLVMIIGFLIKLVFFTIASIIYFKDVKFLRFYEPSRIFFNLSGACEASESSVLNTTWR